MTTVKATNSAMVKMIGNVCDGTVFKLRTAKAHAIRTLWIKSLKSVPLLFGFLFKTQIAIGLGSGNTKSQTTEAVIVFAEISPYSIILLSRHLLETNTTLSNPV